MLKISQRKSMNHCRFRALDTKGQSDNAVCYSSLTIETGKVACKTDYIFVIAKVLNVTSDYLLYGEAESDDDLLIALFNGMSSEAKKKAIKILRILSE